MAKRTRKRPFTRTERVARAKARGSSFYYNDRDNQLDLAKKRYMKNKEHHNEMTRKNHYLYKYGITLEEAKEMLINQDGKCLICKKETSFIGRSGAHVDHSHSTNEIRGILCQKCNGGLGLFEDNMTTLLNAINYLKRRKFILIVSPFEKTAS